MFDWLFQPFPLEPGFRRKMKSAAWGGIVVFSVLFFLRPFGADFGSESTGAFAWLCAQFALVTVACSLLHSLISTLVESRIEEPRWLVWQNILSTLALMFMIVVGNWLYVHFAFGSPLTLKTFTAWIYLTFAVGVIPVLFGYFLYINNRLKKYTSGANALNQEIIEHPIAQTSRPILLKGENQNEELNLKTNELLYITAANNYVEIFYKKGESVEKTLMRSTLKKMETQLAEHPHFFRCHKTFIVNLNKVEKISGNAQGYKLHLSESETLIPVSRSLNKEIAERISS